VTTQEQVRRHLRSLFQKRIWNEKDCASLLGVDPRTIAGFTAGRSRLTPRHLARLEVAVGQLDNAPRTHEQRASVHPVDLFFQEHPDWRTDYYYRLIHRYARLLKAFNRKWPFELPVGPLTLQEKTLLASRLEYYLRRSLWRSLRNLRGPECLLSDRLPVQECLRKLSEAWRSDSSGKRRGVRSAS
jgi:hypothetical protein